MKLRELKKIHKKKEWFLKQDLDEIREFILGQYRIIFQLKGDKAFLLTIHHSSRDLKKKSLLEQLK